MGKEITEKDEVTLIRYDQLAVMLGISKQKARNIVVAGDIPLVEVGPKTHRVRLADVKRYIDRGGRRSNV